MKQGPRLKIDFSSNKFDMNSNIITQLVSVILWIFALAGLQINPDATANDAVVSARLPTGRFS